MSENETIEKVKARQGVFAKIQNVLTLGYGTKENLIDKGLYESDSQVWDHVIEKSMKKDDVINTLLGIEH